MARKAPLRSRVRSVGSTACWGRGEEEARTQRWATARRGPCKPLFDREEEVNDKVEMAASGLEKPTVWESSLTTALCTCTRHTRPGSISDYIALPYPPKTTIENDVTPPYRRVMYTIYSKNKRSGGADSHTTHTLQPGHFNSPPPLSPPPTSAGTPSAAGEPPATTPGGSPPPSPTAGQPAGGAPQPETFCGLPLPPSFLWPPWERQQHRRPGCPRGGATRMEGGTGGGGAPGRACSTPRPGRRSRGARRLGGRRGAPTVSRPQRSGRWPPSVRKKKEEKNGVEVLSNTYNRQADRRVLVYM